VVVLNGHDHDRLLARSLSLLEFDDKPPPVVQADRGRRAFANLRGASLVLG